MTNLNRGDRFTHIIYASVAVVAFSEADLLALLKSARKKNSSLGVTGMLLYYENTFFQAIEGEESTVKELFETIRKDTRHDKIVLIVKEPISDREFPEWSMGFSIPEKNDLALIEGLSDVLSEKEPFLHIQQGRAKKLLSAFAEGRWRVK